MMNLGTLPSVGIILRDEFYCPCKGSRTIFACILVLYEFSCYHVIYFLRGVALAYVGLHLGTSVVVGRKSF